MGKQAEKPKKGHFPLIPGAQVLITGKPVNAEMAERLRAATREFFVGEWCSRTGDIGYIDAVVPNVAPETISKQLQELAQSFPTLDMAVSVMTCPPGSPGHPSVSFLLRNGRAIRHSTPHLLHSPPHRVKS
jgi:hypothetical protein